MRILVLGGTKEARRLAEELAVRPNLVTVSLATAGRQPSDWPVPVRLGGFGGEAGFRDWLAVARPQAIVDATHPFAARITARTARIGKRLDIPCLRLERPPWTPDEGDDWREIGDEAEAAEVIPLGSTVFVATGRRALDRLASLSGRRLVCRILGEEKAPFPFDFGEYMFDAGPFDVAGEAELFKRLGVNWLLTRNSGGEGSWPKVAAARALGLPVAMIRRPEPPEMPRAETVADALDWIGRLG